MGYFDVNGSQSACWCFSLIDVCPATATPTMAPTTSAPTTPTPTTSAPTAPTTPIFNSTADTKVSFMNNANVSCCYPNDASNNSVTIVSNAVNGTTTTLTVRCPSNSATSTISFG